MWGSNVMNKEDILNALKDINSILDGYIERVNTLESNNPEKSEYYKQFLKSIRKVDRCIGGVVLPTSGGCDCSTEPETPATSCGCATTNISFNSLKERIDELEQKKLNVDDYKQIQLENLTLVNSSGKILYTIQGD